MSASAAKTKSHPEGSYFIEWWDEGKRYREPAGANAQDAADKARVKQAELAATAKRDYPRPARSRSYPRIAPP